MMGASACRQEVFLSPVNRRRHDHDWRRQLSEEIARARNMLVTRHTDKTSGRWDACGCDRNGRAGHGRQILSFDSHDGLLAAFSRWRSPSGRIDEEPRWTKSMDEQVDSSRIAMSCCLIAGRYLLLLYCSWLHE